MRRGAGAHTGTGAWLMQRFTAVALAVLLPLLLVRLLAALPVDHEGWRALFAPVWTRVALLLTAAALSLHAWVGVRDILMDYVKPVAARLALYFAAIAVLAGSAAWLLVALWRLG
jgi:succinate dehydrogenase / fumarate reductase membrane anchor subunit